MIYFFTFLVFWGFFEIPFEKVTKNDDCFFFQSSFFCVSKMSFNLLFVSFSVFLLLLSFAAADDTKALRDTLGSLCSYNTIGSFASCCKENENGAKFEFVSSSCFADFLSWSHSKDVNAMFVSLFFTILVA